MKQFAVVAAIAFAVAGCARTELQPSYLGMSSPISNALADEGHTAAPLPQLYHVTSSKVLGAMAYHTVTGRTIDPSRLQGGM